MVLPPLTGLHLGVPLWLEDYSRRYGADRQARVFKTGVQS